MIGEDLPVIANVEQDCFLFFVFLSNYKLFLKHRTSSCKQQIVRIWHFRLNLLKCLLIKKTFYNGLQGLIKYHLKYDTWCYTERETIFLYSAWEPTSSEKNKHIPFAKGCLWSIVDFVGWNLALCDINNEGKRREANQTGLHRTFSLHRCSTYSVSERGHCHPHWGVEGMEGRMKWPEDRTLSASLWFDNGLFLPGRTVCVCVSGRNTCYLMEPLSYTHTHTHGSPLLLCALTLRRPEPVSGSPVHRGSPHPAVNSSLSVQTYTVPPWLRNIKPSANVNPCLHPM